MHPWLGTQSNVHGGMQRAAAAAVPRCSRTLALQARCLEGPECLGAPPAAVNKDLQCRVRVRGLGACQPAGGWLDLAQAQLRPYAEPAAGAPTARSPACPLGSVPAGSSACARRLAAAGAPSRGWPEERAPHRSRKRRRRRRSGRQRAPAPGPGPWAVAAASPEPGPGGSSSWGRASRPALRPSNNNQAGRRGVQTRSVLDCGDKMSYWTAGMLECTE